MVPSCLPLSASLPPFMKGHETMTIDKNAFGAEPDNDVDDFPALLSSKATKALALALALTRQKQGRGVTADEVAALLARCEEFRRLNTVVALVLGGELCVDWTADGDMCFLSADSEYTERFRQTVRGLSS
jgi:hypothetical protein